MSRKIAKGALLVSTMLVAFAAGRRAGQGRRGDAVGGVAVGADDVQGVGGHGQHS